MKKAFTLVELLVAVLLLTLLIGTALFSYRYILLNVKRTQTTSIDKVLSFNQIKSSIESMQYYVVDDYDYFGNPMKQLHAFFYGDEKGLEFISLNPVFSTETSIVKIRCFNGNLLYEEEPFYQGGDLSKPKMSEFTIKKEYATKINNCSFQYMTVGHSLTSRIERELPLIVILSYIDRQEKRVTLYNRVKSDFNISKGLMYELLYSE
jgi:prepilin-type N-terminal cleavage/methylation domain-containing protein